MNTDLLNYRILMTVEVSENPQDLVIIDVGLELSL
jgi:hypothetical protein